jgi:hypothetical protein
MFELKRNVFLVLPISLFLMVCTACGDVNSSTQETDLSDDQQTASAAPSAVADEASTVAGLSVQINVTANDTDDGTLDLSSVNIVSQPSNGTIGTVVGGVVTYTPAAGFSGSDSFSYTIADNDGLVSDPASVTISVSNIVDSSCAEADRLIFYMDEDGDSYGNAQAVTKACEAPQGYVSSHTDCDDTNGGIHPGALEICGDNIDQNCSGADLTCPVPAAPNAVDDIASTTTEVAVQINVAANDMDDGTLDLSSVSIISQPANGTIDTIAGGVVTYTPAAGFSGSDHFSYTIADNDGLVSDPALVTVTISDNQGSNCDEADRLVFYEDADSDNYVDAQVTMQACEAPQGYVADDTDCDDTNEDIHPGAVEICGDAIDQNCSGADLTCPDAGTGEPAPRHVLLGFDTENGNVYDGFPGWTYHSPERDPVGYMVNAGGFQSAPDAGGIQRQFYPYYNGYNSDHMGWLRYGYADVTNAISIAGTGAFRFVATGGAYDDNGSVAYAGLEVRYKEQYDGYVDTGQDPIATRDVPGSFYCYLNSGTQTNTLDELQDANRLSVWIRQPAGVVQSTSNRPDITFSYYPFIDNGGGDHYYHYVSNIALGGWTHVLFDAHPLHNNSGDPSPYSQYRVGGFDAPGDPQAYFARTVKFAFTGVLPTSSPAIMYMDQVELYVEAQPENDETIANIGVGYGPSTHLFDISFNDKYRCLTCNALYEVKYAFSPISNASYATATPAIIVPNADVGFTYNTGVANQIVKPNRGYNQIWAQLRLQPEDEAQLQLGTTLYFAVKDISVRDFGDRDPYDDELVDVPGVGQVRRIDLIKTIDYTIYATPSD